MLGGSPYHALAGELTLKPVLSEIGCSCPTPALFLLDSAWEAGPELDAWVERARDVLPTSVRLGLAIAGPVWPCIVTIVEKLRGFTSIVRDRLSDRVGVPRDL